MRVPASRGVRDGLLAVVLTLTTQGELVVAAGRVEGPLVAQHLAFAVMTAAVALRRTTPLGATLVCAAGMAGQTVAGDAPVVGGFLAMLVVVATLGYHASLRHGALGLAAMAASVVLYDVLADVLVIADLVGNVAIVLMAWGSARLVRVSTDRRVAAELAQDRVARESVLAERTRIARDLHDSVAHALTLITLQAGAARERTTEPVAADGLAMIEQGGREALQDMHRFLGLLGAEDDEGDGRGLRDLEDLLARVRSSGLPVTLHVTGDPAGVPSSVSSAAFRVIQEGLTNTVKHAGATAAEVRVDVRETEITVAVVDDGGVRRPSPLGGSGQGIRGLRERIALYGGELTASGTAHGWRLGAVIPTGR